MSGIAQAFLGGGRKRNGLTAGLERDGGISRGVHSRQGESKRLAREEWRARLTLAEGISKDSHTKNTLNTAAGTSRPQPLRHHLASLSILPLLSCVPVFLFAAEMDLQ